MSYNRVTISVIAGLILFLGVTVSGTSDAPKQGLNPVIKFNPDAPKYAALQQLQPISTIERPGLPNVVENPSAIVPPVYYCEPLYYYANVSYFWLIPDENYPLEEYIMRMTPAEGYVCSLNTIWIAVYGPAHVGTPGMRVTLRDYGFSLIDTVDIDWATIDAAGFGYVSADFSTLNNGHAYIFADGEEFYIGCQVISDGDDTLAVLSDDGSSATGRMLMYLGSPYDDWYAWAGDYAYLFDADVCCNRIPYSNCWTQEWNCGAYYVWPQPNEFGDDFFNMRFSIIGADTLKEIGIAFDSASTIGTPDVDIYVWEDDGYGFPGAVVPGFPVTIPYSEIQWYPDYTVYSLTDTVIFRDDFHVGWSTNDADPTWVLAGLSDDGSCGFLRSSVYSGGAYETILDGYGVDANFLVYAYMCIDEYPECSRISDYCDLTWYWYLPDTFGDVGCYQKFSPPGLRCRLEKIRIALYDNGDPDIYTDQSEIQVWVADPYTGLPLSKMIQFTINPEDYVMYPGWLEADVKSSIFHPFLFNRDIWVGIESFAPDIENGIRTLSDGGECPEYRKSCMKSDAGFSYVSDDWGEYVNFLMEIDVCCIPSNPPPCWSEISWPTYGKDFGRSHKSMGTLSDNPQGTLTKAWQYTASQFGNLNSSVVYKDTVVNYFLDHIVAIDLNTGNEIWKVTDPSGLIIGGGCYATPTIYNLDAYGEDRTVVLTPGGDAKAFSALNLTDGSVFWTNNFLFHQNHFTTWGYSVVVDCNGVPVVYYNDDNGDIYAVNVMDGSLYNGWTAAGGPNPRNFGGSVGKGVTYGYETNLLYIGTDCNIFDGNVTAIDPCTGEIVWDLLTVSGHQLEFLDPDSWNNPSNQPESHFGGIAYDPPNVTIGAPTLYFASLYNPSSDNYFSGGIIYSVNAATGNLNWANLGIAADYCGVTLDDEVVINYGWSPWVTGHGYQKGPTAFSKTTGTMIYTRTTRNPGQDIFMLADGMLSCQNEGSDIFIGGCRKDFLTFYESDWPGRNIFHRRFAGGYNYAHHYAPSMVDEHLLFCYMNKLICLTPQEPRPRLDIPRYRLSTTVEFGAVGPTVAVWPDPADPLDLPGAIGNLGGAPLTIDSVRLADTSNGLIPDEAGQPGGAPLAIVDPRLIDSMEKIASKFASNVELFRASIGDDFAIENVIGVSRSRRNMAAFAIPSWVDAASLTPADGSIIPAPSNTFDSSGSYIPITVMVQGEDVPRGFTGMYLYVYSDDPDYFLDSALIDEPKSLAHAVPIIQLGIVGGCLYDHVEMSFGMGGANWAHIWNATILADGDIVSIEIDGDNGAFWQGAFIFAAEGTFLPPGKPGLFSQRVAHYATNWSAVYPMEWESILPDPDCVAGLCPPQHLTNVLLGTISDSGYDYRDVFGEMVTFAFVDSVQDMCEYDTLGNCTRWNWEYAQSDEFGVQPPYSGAWTMGFKGCATVTGAYDEPRLNNFYIEKFDFSGRYGPINNVWMGGMIDYDINYGHGHKQQVAAYDADLSLAWAYTCNTKDNGWGFVKIPFGCGYDNSMVNAKTITARQGPWNDTAVWLDSVYYWMSALNGVSHQPGTDPAICASDPDDRDFFFTVGQLDMPAGPDSALTIGVAVFGLPDIADADQAATYSELAITADKWCGFYRGDCNDDGDIDPVDIAFLIDFVHHSGPGPYPFMYLGDVDCDGSINDSDIIYLIRYVFQWDTSLTPPFPPPCGEWEL